MHHIVTYLNQRRDPVMTFESNQLLPTRQEMFRLKYKIFFNFKIQNIFKDFCVTRDITDDGSGSIQACLCSTDYCNDVQPVRGAIENEIFDSDRNIKSIFSSTIAPFKPQSRTTTTRTTTTRIFTQRTTTGCNLRLKCQTK